MIVSVKDKRVLDLAEGRVPKRFPANLANVAQRKVRALAVAAVLEDLRTPLGNHLEALRGDRLGQHSIRINDQWRLCFRWLEDGAHDVELVDYH